MKPELSFMYVIIMRSSRALLRVSLTTCNPTPLFKQTVNGWWDVVKTHGLQADPVFSNAALASFATVRSLFLMTGRFVILHHGEFSLPTERQQG